MKKQSLLIYSLLLMGLFLIFTTSCNKDDESTVDDEINSNIELTTSDATSITQTTAISGGNITSDGESSIIARGVCWSTSQNPTVSDSKINDGEGSGAFTSSLTGLTSNTKYYVRAYATNSEGTSYGNEISFTTQKVIITYGSFTDPRDGNVYKTVTIGSQTWMAENLKYLPNVVGDISGKYSETIPYYYVYGYNGTSVADAKATENYNTYGVLYNWPAAIAGSDTSSVNPSGEKGVCPDGWHLPSKAEWIQLYDFLGGIDVAGTKLREGGSTHWESSNIVGTNDVGFTALPGGSCNGERSYSIGTWAAWWSATEITTSDTYYTLNSIWVPSVGYLYNYAGMGFSAKRDAFSVRCVKD